MVAQPVAAIPVTPQGATDALKRKRGRPPKNANGNGKKSPEGEEEVEVESANQENRQKHNNKPEQKTNNGPIIAGESQGKSGNVERGRNKDESMNKKPQGRMDKTRQKHDDEEKKNKGSEIDKMQNKEEEERRNKGSNRGRKLSLGGRNILKEPHRIPKEEEEEDDDDFDFSAIERKIFEGMEDYPGVNRKSTPNKPHLPENMSKRRASVLKEKEEKGDRRAGRSVGMKEEKEEKGGGAGRKMREEKGERRESVGLREGKKKEERDRERGGGSVGRKLSEGKEEDKGGKGRRASTGQRVGEEKAEKSDRVEDSAGLKEGQEKEKVHKKRGRPKQNKEEKATKTTSPGNSAGKIKEEEERKEKSAKNTTENLRQGTKREDKAEKAKIMSPKTESEEIRIKADNRGGGEKEKAKKEPVKERKPETEREKKESMQNRGRKRSANRPEDAENERKRRRTETDDSSNKEEEEKDRRLGKRNEKDREDMTKGRREGEGRGGKEGEGKVEGSRREGEGRGGGGGKEGKQEARRRGRPIKGQEKGRVDGKEEIRKGREGSRSGNEGRGGEGGTGRDEASRKGRDEKIQGRGRGGEKAQEQRGTKGKEGEARTAARGRGGKGREESSKSRGRGDKDGKPGTKMKTTKPSKSSKPAASDSEQSDWEEVDEMEGVDEVKELLSQASSSSQADGEGGVRIELDAPETLWGMRKRRKRRTEEELIEDYLRRKVNETIRKVSLNMHKAHLLCLLAHGRHLNVVLGSGTVLGAALSITPGRAAHPKGRLDLGHLQRLVEWFGKKFPRSKNEVESDYHKTEVEDVLVRRFGTGETRSAKEAVLCFVALCRSLGISARLIIALQPLSWKPAPGTLIKPAKGDTKDSAKGENGTGATDKDGKLAKSSGSSAVPSTSQYFPSSSSMQPEKKMKTPNRKMLSSDSESSPVDTKKRKGRGGGGAAKRTSTEDDDDEEEDEDSDFKPQKTKFRRLSDKTKRRKSQEGDKRRKSQDGGEDGRKKRKTEGLVEWAEVYVEEEEKWVCVDVGRMKIHCVAEIEARMPSGSAYITAFNPDLTIKDVTRRYVSSWLSGENKLRPSSEWWQVSLRPFGGVKSRRDKEEDEEMEKALHLQPLPNTIAEYKNHPLYALQRHLLKFEAIYPPDVSPAGFFKGEPVYPRSSIHNLHSRETWLKEAKSVRVGEEPYKIVKARPKWDRVNCKIIKDRPLEVFGEWQVEDYEPPVASNGKVPRNEYGNVELYKPSMLPRGCVHIPVTGINKLARKLNIDCAPAMVGFDFHSGWTHPVYEGYVVCEEFKDVLMDAWNQEQEEQARRAEEKREKRVYDNWRKLIKGMLVRERVRETYKVSSEEEEETEETEEEEEEKTNKKKKDKEKKVEKTDSKRKIKQSDIDALEKGKEESEEKEDKGEEGEGNQHAQDDDNPPSTSSKAPLITHHVRNLSIDLTSNVVEMAHKSRQRMMKTKNTAKRRERKRKEPGPGGGGGRGKAAAGVKQDKGALGGLSDDSEESDEEAKKEKIRAILNWGAESKVGGPDLSDSDRDDDGDGDSDDRTQQLSSSPFLGFSDLPGTPKEKPNSRKRSSTTRGKRDIEESCSESEEESDASTSRSTTPEPDASAIEAPTDGKRRLSRRSVKGKVKNYKEEEEDAGDISLDESDFEDKSYIPEKKK